MSTMKLRIIILTAVSAGALLTAFSTGQEVEQPKPSYVGATKCKVCHLEIFNSWAETSHRRAVSSLKDEAATDPKCLECHTTGYGAGGYGAEGVIQDLGGVQCEACHGAGSLYSISSIMIKRELSREAGLVTPDSLTCTGCHNAKSPTFKGFTYKAGLLTGTHSRKRG
jgi:nitrate/TMAO reductase-like tetraheme cytochrome c subunit